MAGNCPVRDFLDELKSTDPDDHAAVVAGLAKLRHRQYHREPLSKSVGDGLFELRLKGPEGIARVFYCTLVGKRIVMLHSFIKKTQKTPARELRMAQARMKEIKNAHA